MVSLPLKVDKNLIDSNFDGYKLSLENLPSYSKSINHAVQDPVLKIKGDQSFLITKLVGLFNNFHIDLYSSSDNWSSLYLCNSNSEIVRYNFSEAKKFLEPDIVWTLPDHKLDYQINNENKLPVSIKFISEKLAVVADGIGYLYILDTGKRNEGERKYWEIIHQCSRPLQNDSPFIIEDVMMRKNEDDGLILDCLLHWIASPSDLEGCEKYKEQDISYLSILDWLTITLENSKWNTSHRRRLASKSYPDYLKVTSESILVASNSPYEFLYDSQSPIQLDEMKANTSMQAIESGENSEDAEVKVYTWHQTSEDINVIFNGYVGLTKGDVEVKLTSTSMAISIHKNIVLDCDLWSLIDIDGSTWMLNEEKKLILSLLKKNENQKWDELVLGGDAKGECIMENELTEQIQKLAPLANNEPAFNGGEYEECDFTSETYSLQLLNGSSHKVTHQVDLIGHQFLFTTKHRSDESDVFCIRHDVDGIIWQPIFDEDKDLQLQHLSTFNALGYVLASKQDRKYLFCAPNYNFAAMATTRRHLHIYKQPSPLDSSVELRNRKSGRKVPSVAKQHVISLDCNDNILGLICTNRTVFVMTSSNLYAFDIK